MIFGPHLLRARCGLLAAVVAVVLGATAGVAPAGADAVAQAPAVSRSVTVAQQLQPAAAAKKCSVTAEASKSGLKRLHTIAVDATTGKTLYQKRASEEIPVASVTKLVTSGVAVASLGEDFRFETRVVTGDEEGQIVLVGGGDVTLASGSSNVYSGAATVKQLAKQVTNWAEQSGQSVSEIVLDTSLMTSKDYESSWRAKWRTAGYISRITALQVDGDRDKPSKLSSKRSNDPVTRAGKAFRKALAKQLGVKASTITLTDGTAADDAEQIGVVRSQELKNLLIPVLHYSDNTLAEAIALQVALKETGTASFSKIDTAYKKVLKRLGVSAKGLKFRDGSGLSSKSDLTMKFLSKVLAVYLKDVAGTELVIDRLPVSGKSGTLVNRFSAKYTKKARTHVAAKTGTLDGISSLAGVVTAKDGSKIIFVTAVTNSKWWSGTRQQAIDRLTTRYYVCGANIAK